MVGRRSQFIATSIAVVVLIAIVALCAGKTASQTVRLGNTTYHLETVTTEAAKQKGLGGRNSMAANSGMLFPYTAAGQQCFWMKDMRFSLDILWLDSAHKIVKIEPNLAPKTYPQTYCAVAQYVIELNAGQAARAGLHVGQNAYGL
jgi:uncharacterized membrane protein (UPF0127 family)